jgi:hypothetical protein
MCPISRLTNLSGKVNGLSGLKAALSGAPTPAPTLITLINGARLIRPTIVHLLGRRGQSPRAHAQTRTRVNKNNGSDAHMQTDRQTQMPYHTRTFTIS